MSAMPFALFDPQPVLAGEFLVLRPPQARDADALAAIAADSRVCAPRTWHPAGCPVRDRDRPAGFARFLREALASGGALVALDLVDGVARGRVIGASRFHDYDPVAREVAISGPFLARSHWGGPHHGEMRRLMLAHAFRSVDRVLVGVGPGSMRAQRAVERMGGVRVTPRAEPPSGRARNNPIVYAITAAAFAAAVRVRDHAERDGHGPRP